MTDSARQILTNALNLSERERAELAARLIDSLDDAADDDLDAYWDHELQKRKAEMESGQVQRIAWPEARQIILRRAQGGNAA